MTETLRFKLATGGKDRASVRGDQMSQIIPTADFLNQEQNNVIFTTEFMFPHVYTVILRLLSLVKKGGRDWETLLSNISGGADESAHLNQARIFLRTHHSLFGIELSNNKKKSPSIITIKKSSKKGPYAVRRR